MKLLVESDPLRIRIALLEGERVVEFQVEDCDLSTVGDIYLGRVQRLAPAIDAAFVDLGFERKAFLHADDFALAEGESLSAHQSIVVQIFRDAVPGKGPRVRRAVSLPGRFVVLLSDAQGVAVSSRIEDEAERQRLIAGLEEVEQQGVGWIVRTAAIGVDPEELRAEAITLLARWRAIEQEAARSTPPKLLHGELGALERWVRDRAGDDVREIWVDSTASETRMRGALTATAPEMLERLHRHDGPEPLFERFGVEAQVDAAWARRVSLPSGGSLVIEPTEALVAIDVNSGRDLGAASLEETALATNLEAAREAARQLRLRDLAGIIVIDFIDLASEEHWAEVRAALEFELTNDRATTLVEGPTAFGLFAVTRKRARNDLLQRLSDECGECGGRGRVRSATEVLAQARRVLLARAAAAPGARWRLRLHPEIADAAEGPAAPLVDDLRQRLEAGLEIEPLEGGRRSEFEVLEVDP